MLPHRSRRYGVGKEIGGAIYLHRDYEHLLGTSLQQAKQHLPSNFVYTVVKYHHQSGTISFIQSPDFDTAPEPRVGEIWVVSRSGETRNLKPLADPYIYHHKWLFVADDYPRFSVVESKQRSLAWMSLCRIDFRRIGRKSFWESVVLPQLETVT